VGLGTGVDLLSEILAVRVEDNNDTRWVESDLGIGEGVVAEKRILG